MTRGDAIFDAICDAIFEALIDVDGLNGHGGPCRVIAAYVTLGISMVFAGILCIMALIAVFLLGIAPFYAAVDAICVIAGRQAALKAPWIFLVLPIYHILFRFARRESEDD
jgi:hypothetical protein